MADSKKSSKAGMTDAHKAALAEGRDQGRAVRRYLEALDANKPKRGRKRTPETMKKRLERIQDEMGQADLLQRLQLVQERIDLERQIETAGATVDLTELEQDFVKAASAYSDRKGISYAAWRELGVSAATLQAAGIGRGSG
jgi:ATP-dependent exoDNAse (exonuclease V) beta subunit